MKQVVYLEALTYDENKTIDLIRRCVSNTPYEVLGYVFYKIENKLPLNLQDKQILADNWYYGDTFTTEEIRLWAKMTFNILEDTFKMQHLLLGEALEIAWYNFILDLKFIWSEIRDKCKIIKSKFLR